MQTENNNTVDQPLNNTNNKFLPSPVEIIKELRQMVGLTKQFRRGLQVDGQELKLDQNKKQYIQSLLNTHKKKQEPPQPPPPKQELQEQPQQQQQIQPEPEIQPEPLPQPQPEIHVIEDDEDIQVIEQAPIISEQFVRNLNINERDCVIFTSKMIQQNKIVSEQEVNENQLEIKINNTMQKIEENIIERNLIIDTIFKKIIFQDTYQLIPNQDSQLLRQQLSQQEQKYSHEIIEVQQNQQKILHDFGVQYNEAVQMYEMKMSEMQSRLSNYGQQQLLQEQEKQRQIQKLTASLEEKESQNQLLQINLQQKQESCDELEKQVKLYTQLNDSLRQHLQMFTQAPPQQLQQNTTQNNSQSHQLLQTSPIENSPLVHQSIIIQRQSSSQDHINLSNNQHSQNILSLIPQSSNFFGMSNNMQDNNFNNNHNNAGNNFVSNANQIQPQYNHTNISSGGLNSYQNSQEGLQSPLMNSAIQHQSQPSSFNQYNHSQQLLQTNSQQKHSPKHDTVTEEQKQHDQQNNQYREQDKGQHINEIENICDEGDYQLNLGTDDLEDIFYDGSENLNQSEMPNPNKTKRISKDNNKNKNKQKANQSSSEGSESQPKKKQAKNLPKNYMKAFRSFINSHAERQYIKELLNMQSFDEFEKLRAKINAIIQHNKINNEMIIYFIQTEEYKQVFQFFIENRAEQWIDSSGLLEKSTYYNLLEIYKKSFHQTFYLSKIKVNQTKNHKPITIPPQFL